MKKYFFYIILIFLFNATIGVAQNCGYSFSQTATIDASFVSGTAPLENFPMLFNVTDLNLRTTANGGNVENANGYDIAFLDENGQAMAHELVSYNASTGAIIAWVRIPKLYASFDTQIQLVYGNSNITADPSTSAVWDDDYEAVLHLQESGSGSDDEFKDATSNNHDGTGGGLAGAGSASETPTRVAGKFGFAQDFDDAGSSDFIRLDAVNDASWVGVTVEAWVNPDDNGDDRVFGKSWGTGTGDQTWLLRKTGGSGGARMRTNTNTNTGFDPATLGNGTWQHLAVTWDTITNQLIVYRNGVQEGATGLAGTSLYTTPTVDEPTIGNTTTLNRGYDGLLQEARVSKVARSADWLATQFTNQNDPSSFLSFAPEQGGAFVPVVPTCGFFYQKVITINSSQVSGSGNHTDFPVLISLTDNDLRTVANGGNVQNSNGWDVVFTDSNLIPFDHQIESYDATTGEYIAWIRIPQLPTGTDLDINMFYGDSSVFSDPSTYCVWSSDFEGVWHLDADVNDASANGQDGINNGSINATGKIADAQDFDGTDWIELTSFPNLTGSFTVSAWVRTTDRTQQGQRVFCDDEINSGGYAVSIGDGAAGAPRFYSRSMNNVIVDGTGAIANNTWHYLTAVRDQTNQDRIIYVDGTAIGSDLTDTGTWGTDNGDASIGGETASGETANRFEGQLDEVRVAGAVRSVDWIITEYNNQNNPSSFYSVGSEIELNATSTGNGDWDQTGIWSTGAVPGLGANVTIEDQVDLDDRDVFLCNLTITNENITTDAELEVQNGRTLEVERDVTLIGTLNGDDVIFRLEDANSKLVVNGNFFVNHSGGDDVFVNIEDAGDSLIIRGNFELDHDGGDDLEVRVQNATSVLLVEGDVSANMNSGTDDIMEFDLNDGDFIVNGKFTGRRLNTFEDFELDMDGGNMTVDTLHLISSGGGGADQIMIMVDQNSVLTANYFLMEMGGGDDHLIDINTNAGTDASFIVTGDADILMTGGDDLFIRPAETNGLFHVQGDLTITSTGAEEVQIQVTSTATMDIDGDFTINHTAGQQCHIFTQGTGLANPTLNVDGDFTVNWDGGNDLFNPDLEGGIFSVGGSATINQNSGSGVAWFDCDGGDFSVGDTMFAYSRGDANFFIDLDNSSVFTIGTFIGELSGNSNGEEFFLDIDEDCQFDVTGDMTIQANTGNDFEFHLGENSTNSTAQLNVGGNLLLDHNGSSGVDDIQFYLNDDAQVTVGGDFTMDTDGSTGGAGNFITEINDDAILSVSGNLEMFNSTGSNYLEIEMNNNATLQIGGNIVRNASPNDFGLIQSNSATTTIEYNGTGAQIFADEDGAGTDGIEYELVVINNTFATEPQLTMEDAVTLNNTITFTDGVLQTTSANLLTIGDNATANAGNSGSYVSGPLQKEGDDPFVFPLGKNGVWARLEISDLQNGPLTTDQFTAEYFLARQAESFWDSLDYAGDPGGMHNVSIVEYWDLARDNGACQPKVTLYWESGANSYIDDLTDLRVAHLTGPTAWTNEGGTTSGTVAAGSVTSVNNISTFSVFTFGSISGTSNPLPIELLSFNATVENKVVNITWTTLTELNNDYFTVERSKDGLSFVEIGRLKGAGNSTNRLDYEMEDDAPYSGYSYYRLKQTDYNGKSEYSRVIAVLIGVSKGDVLLYPNPVLTGSVFKVRCDMNLFKELHILSLDGKEIPISYETTEDYLRISTDELERGTYIVKVVEGNQVISKRLVVQ